MKPTIALMAALLALLPAQMAAQEASKSLVNDGTPDPDCSMHVDIDRNAVLPGYKARWGEKEVCLPFTPTNQLVPANRSPSKFYNEEVSDERIRAKWQPARLIRVAGKKLWAPPKDSRNLNLAIRAQWTRAV